jgi:hypothetical protein
MSIDDGNRGSKPSPGLLRGVKLALVIGSLAAAVVTITLVWRSDSSVNELASAPASSRAATTTSLAEGDEVKARLRDILRVRDQAYRTRDVGLLGRVYTTDCPCLRGDVAAIKQLLKDDAVWVGASTSVRISKLEKVSDRVWVIVGQFDASPFRIETKSGNLIRAVQGKSELFRFVLAREPVSGDLLLGFAAPVDQSG